MHVCTTRGCGFVFVSIITHSNLVPGRCQEWVPPLPVRMQAGLGGLGVLRTARGETVKVVPVVAPRAGVPMVAP